MSVLNRLKSFVSTPSPSPIPASPPKDLDKQLAPQDHSPDGLPLPKTAALEALKAAVPLSSCEDCAIWAQEEEEGEGPSFPKKFEVDMDSELLGTSKAMRRLTLISGSIIEKLPHDIGDDTSSLAFFLSSIANGLPGKEAKGPKSMKISNTVEGKKDGPGGSREGDEIPGVYDTKDSKKMTILASNVEVDTHDGTTSAMVFPDYKYIESVPISRDGARSFYDQHLEPSLGRAGATEATLKSYVLPYKAVILLCAHKARDKRCSIAAPLLESVLTSTLSSHGISVDHTGSSLHHLSSSSSIDSYPEDSRERTVERVLRGLSGAATEDAGASQGVEESKEVGIFKISHLGGHRYAGVMIICFPSGATLYYGRVTPKKCVAIVEETILKGKILPQHLRGGFDVKREEGRTLLDW